MHNNNAIVAECILSQVTSRDRAAAAVGDLSEQSLSKGAFWFWSGVVNTTLRAAVSLLAHGPQGADERSLSTFFGIVIGGMRTGLLVPGNLGGTSVMGNLRGTHPGIYGITGWFIVGALAAILCAGMILKTAVRQGRWQSEEWF